MLRRGLSFWFVGLLQLIAAAPPGPRPPRTAGSPIPEPVQHPPHDPPPPRQYFSIRVAVSEREQPEYPDHDNTIRLFNLEDAILAVANPTHDAVITLGHTSEKPFFVEGDVLMYRPAENRQLTFQRESTEGDHFEVKFSRKGKPKKEIPSNPNRYVSEQMMVERTTIARSGIEVAVLTLQTMEPITSEQSWIACSTGKGYELRWGKLGPDEAKLNCRYVDLITSEN